MPECIPQSTTHRVPLQAYLSTDHISAATGKTLAVTISKNGSAYANPSAGATNATEIASGSYYVDLSATDTGTLGPVFVKASASGVDDVILIYSVVKATNGGWTALPDTAVTTNGSLITSGNSTAQLIVTSGYASINWGDLSNKTTLNALTQTSVVQPTVPSLASIVAGVWDEPKSGHTTAGTYGLFLDAAITGRMATYIQPTGFLAATFPTGTIANQTNITSASGVTLAGTQTFSNTGTWTGNLTGSVGSVSGAVGSVTGAVGSVTGNVGGNVTGTVGSLATQAKKDVENAVWDAALSGTSHNTNNSAGKDLRLASTGGQITILSGTAQAGSTSNTIKLSAAASASNDIYKTDSVNIAGGTGAGQTRTIIAYVGSTKVATVDHAWTVTPDSTSTFNVIATSGSIFSDEGLAQAGGASTITLAATSSTSDHVYEGAVVAILSGTGAGQSAEITGYVGATHVATVDAPWTTPPDATSAYAVIPAAGQSSPVAGPTAAQIAVAVRDVDNSAPSAGSLGDKVNSAASGTDPWSISLPGSYGTGTAGFILGTNLDAEVSTRLPTSSYVAPTNPTDYARNNVSPSWYVSPDNPTDYARNNVSPSWYTAPSNPSDYARNNISPSWYTAPDNAVIAAILAAIGDLGSPPTADANAAAVWSAGSRTLTAFGFTVSATATLDVYSLAVLYGNVLEDATGWTFYDATDPATKRVRYARVAAPGGRTVTLDPP